MPLYKPAIDYKNIGVISYDEFEFYSYIWRNSADRFSSECEGWKNSWYRGFTHGLDAKLSQAEKIIHNTSQAIQVYNAQAIKQRIKEQFGKTSSGVRRPISSHNAYDSGVKIGQNYSNHKLLHD